MKKVEECWRSFKKVKKVEEGRRRLKKVEECWRSFKKVEEG